MLNIGADNSPLFLRPLMDASIGVFGRENQLGCGTNPTTGAKLAPQLRRVQHLIRVYFCVLLPEGDDLGTQGARYRQLDTVMSLLKVTDWGDRKLAHLTGNYQ